MSRVRLLEALHKHKGVVWCVTWHPKGETLASCGQDKHIRIWGPEITGNYVVKVLISNAHTQTIREIAWSPTGDCLASAGFDKFVFVWSKNGNEFETTATLELHDSEVKSVAFSNQEPLVLASCGRDKSVAVWTCLDVNDFEFCASLTSHRQDVKRVKFNPYSEKAVLASASYDNTVIVYTEDCDDDWIEQDTLEGHSSTVWSLSFDKSSRIVTCSDDKSIKVWQKSSDSYECVFTMENVHERTVFDVDWCFLTNLIATAGGDNKVKIIEETNTNEFGVSEVIDAAHDQDVNCIRWNPVKKGLFATCSDDGTIKIWKIDF